MKVEKTLHPLAVLWNRNFPSPVEGMTTQHSQADPIITFHQKKSSPFFLSLPFLLMLACTPAADLVCQPPPCMSQHKFFAALIFCRVGEFIESSKDQESHRSHKEAGTHSWENGKKKAGRLQGQGLNSLNVVTIRLRLWYCNILSGKTLLDCQWSLAAPKQSWKRLNWLLWRALFSHALSLMVVIASKMPVNYPSPLVTSRW